jgi:hypothetical protein
VTSILNSMSVDISSFSSRGDQPNAVTLPSIGVSFVPYHIFNRGSFVAAFNNLGHHLIDEWRVPELGCWIPDHPSHSLDSCSGFYFVLDRSGPAEAGIH